MLIALFGIVMIFTVIVYFFVAKKGGALAKIIMWVIYLALAVGLVYFFVRIGWGGWLKGK